MIKPQFSDHLFWDVVREEVDMDVHASFIVQRVLEYGTLQDWRLLRSYYGLDTIVALCKAMRTLDPICLSFICAVFNTSKEEYRCYITRQSNPTLWNS